MHHSYSSIISWKCIIKFLNTSIYCNYIESFNDFYNFYKLWENKKYLKNYTLVFIEINNEDSHTENIHLPASKARSNLIFSTPNT